MVYILAGTPRYLGGRARWLRSRGVPTVWTVHRKAWHLQVTDSDLYRACRKLVA